MSKERRVFWGLFAVVNLSVIFGILFGGREILYVVGTIGLVVDLYFSTKEHKWIRLLVMLQASFQILAISIFGLPSLWVAGDWVRTIVRPFFQLGG